MPPLPMPNRRLWIGIRSFAVLLDIPTLTVQILAGRLHELNVYGFVAISASLILNCLDLTVLPTPVLRKAVCPGGVRLVVDLAIMGLFAGAAFEYYDFYCAHCWHSESTTNGQPKDIYTVVACILGSLLAGTHFFMTVLDFLDLREGRFGWAPTWQPESEEEEEQQQEEEEGTSIEERLNPPTTLISIPQIVTTSPTGTEYSTTAGSGESSSQPVGEGTHSRTEQG